MKSNQALNINEFCAELEANEGFLLVCHIHPDGDTLGSATALAHALGQMGKRVAVKCGDAIPACFDFMLAGLACEDFEPDFIVAVDVASSMDDIIKVFGKEGYSRIPVYKNSIDTIIGTIHEKDFFNAYLKGKKGIDGIMQNAFYTTEHAKISDLLRQLQKKKVHIAVVLDEYGGTLGIVTLEDILEELVGEIYDEHDEVINYFRQIGEKDHIVDGNAPISDMFEYFELAGEEDNFDANTVSGWVIEHLGEIPHAGYQFEYLNLAVEVLKSTVKRVLQIKITVLDKIENENDDDEE